MLPVDTEEEVLNENNLDFENDLHKARTLISSRMDDVRALKKMISETKEKIDHNRRQRILNSINKSGWSKFITPTQHQQLHMLRTQTAEVGQKPFSQMS